MIRKPAAALAVICAVLLCSGIIYAWGVIAAPIAAHLQAVTGVPHSAASVSPAFGLSFFGSSVGIFLSGMLASRFGCRFSLVVAALLVFTGYLGAVSSPSLVFLVLSYGLVFGAGSGIGFGTCVATAVGLFPARRGLTSGLTSMSWGLSAAPMAVVAAVLVEDFGVEKGALALAGFVACAMLAGALLLAPRYEPAQDKPGATRRNPALATRLQEEIPWHRMLRTADFYLMFGTLALTWMGALMIFSQGAVLAIDQLKVDARQAALFVSVLAVSGTFARVVGGAASDRFGRIPTLLASVSAMLAGLACLAASREGSTALFALGCVAVGLTYGTYCGVYPSFVADRFGPRELARNYGFFNLSGALAGFAGPALVALSSPEEHYALAYAAAGACALASAGLCCVLLIRNRKRNAGNG